MSWIELAKSDDGYTMIRSDDKLDFLTRMILTLLTVRMLITPSTILFQSRVGAAKC